MAVLYPEEIKQQEILQIIKEVLGQKYFKIDVTEFILRESADSTITCTFSSSDTDKNPLQIEGKGVGMVDALYNGIMDEMSKKHESLSGLEFEDFSVKVKFQGNKNTRLLHSPVEICLVVAGSKQKRFYFRAQSRSIAMAAVKVVSIAVEYLVNAELAVIELHRSILDADNRSREDLKKWYTAQLSEVVRVASYEKVIKKLDKGNY